MHTLNFECIVKKKTKTKTKKKKLQAIERKTLSVHPLVLLSVFTFTNVKE